MSALEGILRPNPAYERGGVRSHDLPGVGRMLYQLSYSSRCRFCLTGGSSVCWENHPHCAEASREVNSVLALYPDAPTGLHRLGITSGFHGTTLPRSVWTMTPVVRSGRILRIGEVAIQTGEELVR